jgi:hypothetical protein
MGEAVRIPMMSAEDVPEISDATAASSVLMMAVLEREMEQSALHSRMAEAVLAGDVALLAGLHREMAVLTPSVARVPRLARASAARYDDGTAPHLPTASMNARAKRALLRIALFTENRLPQYWRSPEPPAPTRPTAVPDAPATEASPCAGRNLALLALSDQEIAAIGPPATRTARRALAMLVEGRNRRAAACRACAACPESQSALTLPLPD